MDPFTIGTAATILSMGSTIFNIGQSMKNQRAAREQRREALRQRVAGLQAEATNYQGDAGALINHLVGTKDASGERTAGLLGHRENVLGDVNQFYDQSRSQMRNLFNYAGMSGPRAQVLMNQVEQNRTEDLAEFGDAFNEQRTAVTGDILTASSNAYDALREAQQGVQTTSVRRTGKLVRRTGALGGTSDPVSLYVTERDLEEAARGVFEKNASVIEGALDFIGNINEIEEAFEDPEHLQSIIKDHATAENYEEAAAFAKAASGASLTDKEIEKLGMQKQYSEVVQGEDGNYLVTYELDNDAISQMLKEQFENYAEGKSLSTVDIGDIAGEGSRKEVKRKKIFRGSNSRSDSSPQNTRREKSKGSQGSSKTGSGHDQGRGRTDRPSGGQGVNVEY